MSFRICLLHKKLCNYLFFAFQCNPKSFVIACFLSLQCFWTDWQKFCEYVSQIVSQHLCDQYQSNFIGLTGKCLRRNCSGNQNFRVCEHDMPCALEKIVMPEESEHVEFSSLTTKIIPSQS